MYRQLIAERNAMIVSMYEAGLAKSFIAEQLGMKIREVRGVIRRANQIVVEVVLE